MRALALACVALACVALACAPTRAPTPEGVRGLAVDRSFATELLEYLASPRPELRARLLAHPGLAALGRHAALAGEPRPPEAILDRLVASRPSVAVARASLGALDGRDDAVRAAAASALALLPPGCSFHGTLYLELGYDIGVLAPPRDIALNVAHPRFAGRPEELLFYVTHEAHHLGFHAYRPAPPVSGLEDPARLLAVIDYFTQLEGMAVHAAFEPRRRAGALAAEPDYAVYDDEAAAGSVVRRYAALRARVARGALSGQDAQAVLEAMTSGDRLWYRFGALVARDIQLTRGRAALVRSVTEPELWRAAVAARLASAGARGGPGADHRARAVP